VTDNMEEQRPNSVEPIPMQIGKDANECQTAGRGINLPSHST